ncbi:MAG: UDP-N-acetylglucosamine diphosphorylase [Chlamydiae bacterium RIFCSPLOWO2_12_FULL_49_12]|nr:MAG: UDP-N-acetylglucosamine diphosphorylase [Chlamydiae bacterium RIFCSPLOWO2_12_FULL_49_12]
MEELTPNAFFDLEKFSHAALFEECRFVWEALIQMEAYLKKASLGGIECAVPSAATLVHPESIAIGKGTVIEEGSYLRGPCLIGAGCTIRQGAYLRGPVILGDGCVIGHASEVKHTIALNEAHIAHFNYVGDSILGNGVNLGAGFICSNLRFDKAPVVVVIRGKRIETGCKKLGLIAGDGSHLGCNGVSNPGTLLGKQAVAFPCLNFGGFHGAHALIAKGGKRR